MYSFLEITSYASPFLFSFLGKSHICPECGSDHVVQLADQSDHYSSTPIDRPPRAKSEDDHLDITQSARGVKVCLIGQTLILPSSFPPFCCNLFLFLIHRRMTTRTPASAVVPSWRPAPPRRIPPSPLPRGAPS